MRDLIRARDPRRGRCPEGGNRLYVTAAWTDLAGRGPLPTPRPRRRTHPGLGLRGRRRRDRLAPVAEGLPARGSKPRRSPRRQHSGYRPTSCGRRLCQPRPDVVFNLIEGVRRLPSAAASPTTPGCLELLGLPHRPAARWGRLALCHSKKLGPRRHCSAPVQAAGTALHTLVVGPGEPRSRSGTWALARRSSSPRPRTCQPRDRPGERGRVCPRRSSRRVARAPGPPRRRASW